MPEQKSLDIQISIAEDENRTEASASVGIGGTEHVGLGLARRYPDDPNVPMIGEELATARALMDLSHNLMEAAAKTLEDHIGHPVTLTE